MSELNVPAMDRPSIYFAHLLDSIEVEEEEFTDPHASSLYLACHSCSERVCLIEEGDSMRTLLNTVLAHTC